MLQPPPKQVIIVLGPTASGKTELAINLARHFNTEIISCDSRQCYKELNIGVARPSEQELAAVPHHFIATHSIEIELTAADFEKYALEKSAEIFQNKDTVIMAGGTGLYIRAFCEGLDAIPEVAPAIRAHIISEYGAKGIQWLQEELLAKDPLFASGGEMQNPQRMMRALEVLEATGHSIQYYQRSQKVQRPFSIRKIGIDLPREELNRRIDLRVDHMIETGLLEEVHSLQNFKHHNALRTVGYSELFAHLEGSVDLPTAISLIKIHTRQYAKRQMTWFRKDTSIRWISPPALTEVLSLVSVE